MKQTIILVSVITIGIVALIAFSCGSLITYSEKPKAKNQINMLQNEIDILKNRDQQSLLLIQKLKSQSTPSLWTSVDVYSLSMLYSYGGEFMATQNISHSMVTLFANQPEAAIYLPEIYEAFINRLKSNKERLLSLKLSQNYEYFEEAKNAYIEAINAEIDVLSELIKSSKTYEFSASWNQKLDTITERSIQAQLELAAILFKIDPNMTDTVQNLK